MTELGRVEPADDDITSDIRYAWVTRCPVGDFVPRMQALRKGDPEPGGEKPQPEAAVRVLYEFAKQRPIGELVESARLFADQDAVNVLATAALCRGSEQAAELAVRQWEAEQAAERVAAEAERAVERVAAEAEAGPGGAVRAAGWASAGRPAASLTYGLIHDVACQRTTQDVAKFVRHLKAAGHPELVARTLEVFSGSASGRTSFDKALLYIALRGQNCPDEAAELLRRTLESIGRNAAEATARAEVARISTVRTPLSRAGPVWTTVAPEAVRTDPAELHDLVGALHRLSPSERIVETWFDERLRRPEEVRGTRELAATLISSAPVHPETLIEHVGRRFSRYDLIKVCTELIDPAPDKCAEIRRYAAARAELEPLADIVSDWYGSEKLSRTTRDLLDEIVVRGRDRAHGPRPVEELNQLDTVLSNHNADPECRRLLWVAAAGQTAGRTGEELFTLLRRVRRPRDRRRAAQDIAKELTARVLGRHSGPEVFVEYLSRLRDANENDAVFVTCKELADPSGEPERSPHGSGPIIAEIAARLYGAPFTDDGWDLLERCLENEQRVTPQDVARVVARLRDSDMPPDDRLFLLRATVGRWSDAGRREQAVGELRAQRFDAEAAEVVRSLR